MTNKGNDNLKRFADELSELIGQPIGLAHIHPCAVDRYYYTQAPKAGAPMLLHHYRGPFFVDMNPVDIENIASGKFSIPEYINSANWQVGYYWGGGSMLGGGYYQPLDLINRKDEIRRYLQILSCRGAHQSSGYVPSEKNCGNCSVENCPLNQEGNWNEEMHEPDPRRDLFNALCERLEQENPGYTLSGIFASRLVPDGEVWIAPNSRHSGEKFSFIADVSSSVIQSLLMHEIEPVSWSDYANSFQFRILKIFDGNTYDVTEETLKKAFAGLDYTTNTKPKR